MNNNYDKNVYVMASLLLLNDKHYPFIHGDTMHYLRYIKTNIFNNVNHILAFIRKLIRASQKKIFCVVRKKKNCVL